MFVKRLLKIKKNTPQALICTKNWWQKSNPKIFGIIKFQNVAHNNHYEIWKWVTKNFLMKKAKNLHLKKGKKDSFYLEGNIEIKDNRIKLPHFKWIKLSEKVEDLKEIKNVRISRQADYWFVSLKLNTKKVSENITKQPPVGVDLGIKTLATLSNGMYFENKRPYKKYQRQLKLEQRKLSKKYKKDKKNWEQSNNYQKQRQKVARLHYKISCIRKDTLHKLTTYLAKNHSEVVIEDLNVRGMSKNHKLASAILDGGFYEFRRQLTYKCEWYGTKLTIADRFFASSKTCSSCGCKKEKLALSERIFVCSNCGFEAERDLNASLNLAKQAVS